MNRDPLLHPNQQKQWENFYYQTLTQNGQESIIDEKGRKQLILLPMLTYTLFSTMLQKLKYLPNECFNRIIIGETPVCGLRPLDSTSPSLMLKLTDILRTIIDGVRKQQILNITMIFYQKNNLNLVYDSYSLVFDYSVKLSDNQSNTSIHTIAHIIHQIEYMFNWNDAFPNDVELTFVLSALDQFDNDEHKIPLPFTLIKQAVKNVFQHHETNHMLGRLTTPDGKIWLKFLPNYRQQSGSTILSEDLPTKANIFANRPTTIDNESIKATSKTHITKFIDNLPMALSPKLKKKTKRSTISVDSSKSEANLPSLTPSTQSKIKKRNGLLSAVKSLITPSRTPAPVTASTPNSNDLVLIHHTSTPKPGETASRIMIGSCDGTAPLSAIQEVSTYETRPVVNPNSPTPSIFTTTDISMALTPTFTASQRSSIRPPTARGQAAIARKKIAAMQIRDDSDSNDGSDDDENEQFNNMFNRRKPKKTKKPTIVLMKTTNNLSDVSSISSTSSNLGFTFTPPTARKRPTTDRADADDLAIEHGTPPKTPRTARRNRILDQTTSTQHTPMDIGDLHVTIDSPRLLRSVTKKLQQQASEKKQFDHQNESSASKQSKSQEQMTEKNEINRPHISLERSSIALHYSMDESD